MVGMVVGAMTSVLLAHGVHRDLVRGVVMGLVAAVVCVAGYLTWLYGRAWYEWWVVARHTYRPEDH